MRWPCYCVSHVSDSGLVRSWDSDLSQRAQTQKRSVSALSWQIISKLLPSTLDVFLRRHRFRCILSPAHYFSIPAPKQEPVSIMRWLKLCLLEIFKWCAGQSWQKIFPLPVREPICCLGLLFFMDCSKMEGMLWNPKLICKWLGSIFSSSWLVIISSWLPNQVCDAVFGWGRSDRRIAKAKERGSEQDL